MRTDPATTVDSTLLTRADELPVLRLTADLRIDGDEHFLGQVRQLRVWNGTLVFLEEREDAIRFFNMEGDSIGRFGRAGEGPGEFRSLNRISWLADTLWVYDPQLARITFIAPDRTLLRTANIPLLKQDSSVYAGYNVQAVYPDGTLLGFAARVRPNNSTVSPPVAFLHIAADGAILRKIVEYSFASISVEYRDPSGWTQSIGVSPPLVEIPRPVPQGSLDGRRLAFMTTTHAEDTVTLHVTMFDIIGDTTWTRDYPFTGDPLPKSVVDGGIDRVRANPPDHAPRRALNELVDRIRAESPRVYVGIRGSFYDTADRIWIRLPSAPDRHRWFIMDADGNFVARVIVPPDVTLVTATPGHAWGYEYDEYGVLSIIRYA